MEQVQYIDGNPKYLPESVSSGTQATKLIEDAVLPKELSNTQNFFIFKLLSHILPAFQESTSSAELTVTNLYSQ